MNTIPKNLNQIKDCRHVSKKDWEVVMNDINRSQDTYSVLFIDSFNAKPLYVPSYEFRYHYPYNVIPESPPLFYNEPDYLKWFANQIQSNTFYLRIHVCNPMELMTKVISRFNHLNQINVHFFILNKECIQFLVNNCPNLEVIHFENSIGIHYNSCHLLTKLMSLMHLNLSRCDIYENSLEVILKNCQNLKSLNISGNCQITGRCLVYMSHSIERLDFRECWSIESSEIIAMTRLRLETLSELIVNSGINDECMAEICTNCKNIRHLNISFECMAYYDECGRRLLSESGFSEIAKLVNLEILILRHVGKLTDKSLQTIIKGCKHLTQLIVNVRHRHKLTDNALQDIALLCPSLLYLESVHNHFIGKSCMMNMRQMPNIVSLVLRGNELVDNDISQVISDCKSLRYVNLDGCNVNESVLMACVARALQLLNYDKFSASLIRTNIDRNVLHEKVLPLNLWVRVSGPNNLEHFSEFNGKTTFVGRIQSISPYYWLDFS